MCCEVASDTPQSRRTRRGRRATSHQIWADSAKPGRVRLAQLPRRLSGPPQTLRTCSLALDRRCWPCAMTTAESFDVAKGKLPVGAWRALEKAHEAVASNGLPCGAALVDDAGVVVSEGRCSAFDLREGGTEPLGTTPLGHAEMNVLAAVPTSRDLSDVTLWSTQQPCSMCTAALDFVGVGSVRYLAADPAFQGTSDPRAGQILDPTASEQDLEPWAILGNALFLQGSLGRYGTEGGAVVRNLATEPETAELAIALWSEGVFAGDDLEPIAEAIWPRVLTAAQKRRQRLEPAL